MGKAKRMFDDSLKYNIMICEYLKIDFHFFFYVLQGQTVRCQRQILRLLTKYDVYSESPVFWFLVLSIDIDIAQRTTCFEFDFVCR